MADGLEGIRGVWAGFLQQDSGTAWMPVHPLRDVVDLAANDQPQVTRASVMKH
jgi:hypothetical protein